uniref:Cohesin domain-containing protein n=1 Tax=Globisporangium ultimum (strain ATCC 200006 / CBS 805.95 / DAOM BR144) TaxID=431595 RepID=K3WAF1_GLOUD
MTTRSVQHLQWRLCGVFSLLLVCVATLLLGSGVQVVDAVLTNTKVAPVSPIAGVTISIKSLPFSVATIVPDSLDAGVTGLTTVTFTSDVTLPIGSKIVVTFPSEFGVASSRVAAVASLDASSTVAVTPSSSEVVVTIAGSAIASGSTVTFQLDGITNPGAVTTGSFSLESRASADKVYQQAAAIAPETLALFLGLLTVTFG